MNYYMVSFDYDKEEYALCKIKSLAGIDEYSLYLGDVLEYDGAILGEYDSSSDEYLLSDYIGNDMDLMIFNEKIISNINSFIQQNTFQLIPVTVHDTAKEKDIRAYYVNILDILDYSAIDLDSSQYYDEVVDGEIVHMVIKYALFESEIEGHDLFMIKNDVAIFCSEVFKQYVENHKYLGFDFQKIDIG